MLLLGLFGAISLALDLCVGKVLIKICCAASRCGGIVDYDRHESAVVRAEGEKMIGKVGEGWGLQGPLASAGRA